MSTANDHDEENISGNWERNDQMIKDKIIHILTWCPTITPSMLQIGLGPGLSTAFWRPVFNRMVADGELTINDQATTGPTGRTSNMKLISLTKKE